MDIFSSISPMVQNPASNDAMRLAQAKEGNTFLVHTIPERVYGSDIQLPRFYYKSYYHWISFSEIRWRQKHRLKKTDRSSLPLITLATDFRVELKFVTYANGENDALPSIHADTNFGKLNLTDCGICPDPITGRWAKRIPVIVTNEKLRELEEWLRWWRRIRTWNEPRPDPLLTLLLGK